nr:MAG TPA: hypothetical protein [Caudoviricetes sp.]
MRWYIKVEQSGLTRLHLLSPLRRDFFRALLFICWQSSGKASAVGETAGAFRRLKNGQHSREHCCQPGAGRGGSHLPHSLLMTYTILVLKIHTVNRKYEI